MLENLPMRTLTFLADDTLVAAGCDFKPALFTLAGSDWLVFR
jgi:hypothetical protein